MPSSRPDRYILPVAIVLLLSLAYDGRGAADEELPPAGQIATVNGIDLYYEIHGQGEPLLLLHGFGGAGALWQPYLADLGAHYQLIVPDLRGHGRSTNPSGKFTHRQAAQDVLALLDALHMETCRGMGISTGGMTLLHMATSQPERVEAMVLIGATHYFPEQCRAIQRGVDPDKLTEDQLASSRELHQHGDEQIRALTRQFRDFATNYDDMNFTPPFLSTIRARTLILHGDRDAFFPVAIPVELYQSIPQSYLWIVPNGGHVPLTADTKMQYLDRLLAFLRGEWEQNNAPR